MADAESTNTEEERLRQQAQQRLERRRRKMQSPEESLAKITGRPVEPAVATSSDLTSPPALPVSAGCPSVGTMTAEDPPLETLTRDQRPNSLLRQGSSQEADLLSSLLGSCGAEGSADPRQADTKTQLTDLVWVLLAVVVRLLLDTEYSAFIGHNIFLPFALSLSLMMSLGYINLSLATSTGSTILSAGRVIINKIK